MHGVRGLEVEVGHRLGVGQDAGGDHEGQHVHRDQQHRAHGEREQQALEEITVTVWTLEKKIGHSLWECCHQSGSLPWQPSRNPPTEQMSCWRP